MKSMPRILPLVGVAIGGVLAINALAGARDLPALLSGAQAFAENAAKAATPAKGAKSKDAKAAAKPPAGETAALTGEAMNAAATGLPPPTISPRAVCAPTAAELAKEAGLSPAELQVLQNLGERRGQLDKREDDLSTQTALMAAAEAKVDAKLKALTALKADVQGLLAQADGREASEVDRLVKVFESMKPKDAAPRFVLLDDNVRLPIAAKMKEKSLSSMLAVMPPADAKKLTESLAHRFAAAQTLAQNANAVANGAAAPTAPAADKAAKPAKKPPAKQAQRKAAPADAQADATPSTPAAAPAEAPPAPKVG
jgi:flagellar motility protein MotE (MotC chaperone)